MPYCSRVRSAFLQLLEPENSETIQNSERRTNLNLDKRVTGAGVKHVGCELKLHVVDADKESLLMVQRPLKKHLVTLPGISKTEPP
jgi:hypothetical protein